MPVRSNLRRTIIEENNSGSGTGGSSGSGSGSGSSGGSGGSSLPESTNIIGHFISYPADDTTVEIKKGDFLDIVEAEKEDRHFIRYIRKTMHDKETEFRTGYYDRRLSTSFGIVPTEIYNQTRNLIPYRSGSSDTKYKRIENAFRLDDEYYAVVSNHLYREDEDSTSSEWNSAYYYIDIFRINADGVTYIKEYKLNEIIRRMPFYYNGSIYIYDFDVSSIYIYRYIYKGDGVLSKKTYTCPTGLTYTTLISAGGESIAINGDDVCMILNTRDKIPYVMLYNMAVGGESLITKKLSDYFSLNSGSTTATEAKVSNIQGTSLILLQQYAGSERKNYYECISFSYNKNSSSWNLGYNSGGASSSTFTPQYVDYPTFKYYSTDVGLEGCLEVEACIEGSRQSMSGIMVFFTDNVLISGSYDITKSSRKVSISDTLTKYYDEENDDTLISMFPRMINNSGELLLLTNTKSIWSTSSGDKSTERSIELERFIYSETDKRFKEYKNLDGGGTNFTLCSSEDGVEPSSSTPYIFSPVRGMAIVKTIDDQFAIFYEEQWKNQTSTNDAWINREYQCVLATAMHRTGKNKYFALSTGNPCNAVAIEKYGNAVTAYVPTRTVNVK